jgi:hypothetical protein
MITLSEKPNVVYTLKDNDHAGLPSLKRLYLEECDPTEYRFATKYLGGWEHWKKLRECEWFKPYLDSWREELELRLKSDQYYRIMKEAQDDLNKNSHASRKFIIETVRKIQRNEDLSEKNTKGRPSKDAIDRKALEIAQTHDDIRDDLKRIVN